MDFIDGNLKKAGIFNTILIIAGVVFTFFKLFTDSSVIKAIAYIFQLVAFVFALNYTFMGYKKNAAKSYKSFLIAYELSMFLNVIAILLSGNASIVWYLLTIIDIVIVFVLAFVKDYGEKASFTLAIIEFASSLLNLIIQALSTDHFLISFVWTLSTLILSAVLVIFVVAKYRDKARRGSK